MKTTHTDEQLQTAIDAAGKITCKKAGLASGLLYVDPEKDTFPLEANVRLILAKTFLEKLEAKPNTFEAHGKTWTKHTPGDPMPCDGKALIEWMTADELRRGQLYSNDYFKTADYLGDWQNVIGWRYADAPQANPVPDQTQVAWTPAVGDVVRLKSEGPMMVVTGIESTVWCAWFHENKLHHLDSLPTCLTLIKEGAQ